MLTRGRNAALDVTGKIGKVDVTATVFANEIRHPLTLAPSVPSLPPGPPRELVSAPGPARTTGGEVFLTYDVAPIVFTGFYAYLWATELDPISGARHEAPRNPRHNFFLDVTWEGTAGLWIALEANFIGRQALDDDPSGMRSPGYANLEFLVMKSFGRASVYLNADNLTNVLQQDTAPLLRPVRGAGQSWTVGQWAPVEGRVLSAGIRYRLGRR